VESDLNKFQISLLNEIEMVGWGKDMRGKANGYKERENINPAPEKGDWEDFWLGGDGSAEYRKRKGGRKTLRKKGGFYIVIHRGRGTRRKTGMAQVHDGEDFRVL